MFTSPSRPVHHLVLQGVDPGSEFGDVVGVVIGQRDEAVPGGGKVGQDGALGGGQRPAAQTIQTMTVRTTLKNKVAYPVRIASTLTTPISLPRYVLMNR